MRGDITIYIAPCEIDDNRKKYNCDILKIMEESKLEYKVQISESRLQGLTKVEICLEDEKQEKYKHIAKELKLKLETQGINVKRVVDFKGKFII